MRSTPAGRGAFLIFSLPHSLSQKQKTKQKKTHTDTHTHTHRPHQISKESVFFPREKTGREKKSFKISGQKKKMVFKNSN